MDFKNLKKLFDGRHKGKLCFVCHGKGHHLSNSQYKKLVADCKDKKGQVNWKKVDGRIDDGGMRCNVCHGEKRLYFNFNFSLII